MPYRFSFDAFDPAEDVVPIAFHSNLKCNQCTALVNNRRCRRRVCIGLPYCWSHTRNILGLRKSRSTIPNAGEGIFAYKRKFAKGEVIAPYSGEIIPKIILDSRYGSGSHVAPYAIEVKRHTTYEDGAIIRGIGTLPNDPTLSNFCGKVNAEFIRKRVKGEFRIFLKAKRAIAEGSEIFVKYGNEYVLEDLARHSTKYIRK